MLDIALGGQSQGSDSAPTTITASEKLRATTPQPRLGLRSRLPGRERWYVDRLEDNPRLAAAVEMVLRTEEGIEEVRANPLTGRVLVRYRPDSVSEPVPAMLRRAIQAGPLTPEEFAAFQAKQPQCSFSKQLLGAEVVCSLSHILLFGGFCPLGLAATGVLLLAHRHSRTHADG
jgi:hypothetical protein